MSGSRYVGLYPRAWRERYGDELVRSCERERLGLRARAWTSSAAPSTPTSTRSCHRGCRCSRRSRPSALAVAHAHRPGGQPVADRLAGLPGGRPAADRRRRRGHDPGARRAVAEARRRGRPPRAARGDRRGRSATWPGSLALAAAATRVDYGPLTAVAATLAMTGTAVLGDRALSGGAHRRSACSSRPRARRRGATGLGLASLRRRLDGDRGRRSCWSIPIGRRRRGAGVA